MRQGSIFFGAREHQPIGIRRHTNPFLLPPFLSLCKAASLSKKKKNTHFPRCGEWEFYERERTKRKFQRLPTPDETWPPPPLPPAMPALAAARIAA
jgi:hypothetical protein